MRHIAANGWRRISGLQISHGVFTCRLAAGPPPEIGNETFAAAVVDVRDFPGPALAHRANCKLTRMALDAQRNRDGARPGRGHRIEPDLTAGQRPPPEEHVQD